MNFMHLTEMFKVFDGKMYLSVILSRLTINFNIVYKVLYTFVI